MVHMEGLKLIKYKSIFNSLISDSFTTPIINLGLHGFADSFFSKEMYSEASSAAPLICRLDKNSGLVQVENLTFADVRYNSVDYAYTSSNSQTSRDHWSEFILSVHKRKKLNGKKILEIGSNDGYLLKKISAYTGNTLGIDASGYMTDMANSTGVKTIKGVFGESQGLTAKIKEEYDHFDLIFANNVLNHSNNPIAFISEVARVIAKDGIFVFEVPYWLETIKTFRFDQIYHEHITYFSIESAEYLLNKCGFFINDVQIINYHGGSLRVYASLNNSISTVKNNLLNIERGFNLKEESTYFKYFNQVNKFKNIFLENLNNIKKENQCVFGIGAAAKSNTFLTYYGFNQNSMNFILDASVFKQGKITPVTRIPIVPDEFVTELREGIGIVLAWNLGLNLKNKLLGINKNIEFMDSFDSIN